MTGGMGTEIVTAVLQYSMTGDHVALPSLTIGRYAHACGHFTNSNGAIVSGDRAQLNIYPPVAGLHHHRREDQQ